MLLTCPQIAPVCVCTLALKAETGGGRVVCAELQCAGWLCAPHVTQAVCPLLPQIIRVQSPEGVKRITATKRETVATFLKKVLQLSSLAGLAVLFCNGWRCLT